MIGDEESEFASQTVQERNNLEDQPALFCPDQDAQNPNGKQTELPRHSPTGALIDKDHRDTNLHGEGQSLGFARIKIPKKLLHSRTIAWRLDGYEA